MFGIEQLKMNRIGSVCEHNQRSVANRKAVISPVKTNDLLEPGVKGVTRRGTTATRLKIKNADISDPEIVAKVVVRSKQFPGFEDIPHAD